MKRFINFSITAVDLGFFSSTRTRCSPARAGEREHGHDPDDDVAGHRPAVVGKSDWTVPRCTPSCQPRPACVTTVGMISTIFGIRRVVNSIRAGSTACHDRPSTKPRNRSMTVHDAPRRSGRTPAARVRWWRSPRSAGSAPRYEDQPLRGTISKSGRSIVAGGAPPAQRLQQESPSRHDAKKISPVEAVARWSDRSVHVALERK